MKCANQECSNEFELLNCKHKKYCSFLCHKITKWKRQETRRQQFPKFSRICRTCHNEYKTNTKDGVFCSRKCRGKPKIAYSMPDRLAGIDKKFDKNIGYVRVYAPEHPKANTRGYVYEHRLIAEVHILGRRLQKDEVVHHINHVRHDNRIENLQVMSRKEHDDLHALEKRKHSNNQN